jgi:N-acetyl-1-D-myo-inositol-2-amino-2-deoxy-alpha-D-glucopyranoside deacetylase
MYWAVVTPSMFQEGLAALRAVGELPFPLPADDELPGVPDEAVTSTIDISQQMPSKVAAIRAHATQIVVWEPRDWGGTDGAPAWVITMADGRGMPLPETERFVLAGGRADPSEVATDLFGGYSQDGHG